MTVPTLSKFPSVSETSKGILLALVSNALFLSVGVLVRILSERIDIFQILFFRQLIFVVLLLPAISKNIQTLIRPRHVKFHVLRIVGAFFALLLGFMTVSNLPLAEATALGFTSVLFVALISSLFLSESVGKSRQFTLLAGFIGVILVVQPTFRNLSIVYTLTGLGAALAAAVAVFCVRKIARVESTINLLVYQAVFVGLIALIPSIYFWQWPTLPELALLLLVGGMASIGQWLAITAYKFGEANVVANVEYVKMVYSLVLGYWIFAEAPNMLALCGASVIVVSPFLPQFLKGWAKKVRTTPLAEKF